MPAQTHVNGTRNRAIQDRVAAPTRKPFGSCSNQAPRGGELSSAPPAGERPPTISENEKVLSQLRQSAMSVETLMSSIAISDRQEGQISLIWREEDVIYNILGQSEAVLHWMRHTIRRRASISASQLRVLGASHLLGSRSTVPPQVIKVTSPRPSFIRNICEMTSWMSRTSRELRAPSPYGRRPGVPRSYLSAQSISLFSSFAK